MIRRFWCTLSIKLPKRKEKLAFWKRRETLRGRNLGVLGVLGVVNQNRRKSGGQNFFWIFFYVSCTLGAKAKTLGSLKLCVYPLNNTHPSKTVSKRFLKASKLCARVNNNLLSSLNNLLIIANNRCTIDSLSLHSQASILRRSWTILFQMRMILNKWYAYCKIAIYIYNNYINNLHKAYHNKCTTAGLLYRIDTNCDVCCTFSLIILYIIYKILH